VVKINGVSSIFRPYGPKNGQKDASIFLLDHPLSGFVLQPLWPGEALPPSKLPPESRVRGGGLPAQSRSLKRLIEKRDQEKRCQFIFYACPNHYRLPGVSVDSSGAVTTWVPGVCPPSEKAYGADVVARFCSRMVAATSEAETEEEMVSVLFFSLIAGTIDKRTYQFFS
jgi:hypothetical protein